MRKILLAALAAIVLFSCGRNEAQVEKLNRQAESEYLVPVRPGYEGRNPFWNAYSKKFIYAPAFDFKEVEGAENYRFTVTGEEDSWSFVANHPTEPISPIWNEIPVGKVHLEVEALSPDGKVVGIAGERDFLRDFPFEGPYPAKARPYGQAARMALLYVHQMPQVLAWKDSPVPDMSYNHNTYANKIIGATISNECFIARLYPELREDALAAARNAAAFLISVSRPEGDPLAFFPPTYYQDLIASKKNQGLTMTMDALYSAQAFLDLYDETSDSLYLDRALKIAGTYEKIQGEDGSFPIKVHFETGEPVNGSKAMLAPVLRFVQRLEKQYGIMDFTPMKEKAFKWMDDVALKTFDLTGQFEDVGVDVKPYQNLTNCTAAPFASCLLHEESVSAQDIADAYDLVRFSEDQFVHWRSLPRKNGIPHVSVPCVHEQYHYETPVDNSSCNVANALLDLYEHTGDELCLAKALALADGLTISQSAISGQMPTTLDYRDPVRSSRRTFWINCSLSSARLLLRLESLME